MTIALLFLLGTCHVQIQSVQVDYACTKRLMNLSAEAIINARNVGLCARCALFLLKIKQIRFSCRLVKGFKFLKRAQSQFKMLLEMSIFLASFFPTERNANLSEVTKQFRNPFMIKESVEPGCLFTKFLLCYKSTYRRHKQTKYAFFC